LQKFGLFTKRKEKGWKQEISNYRPILILPVFSPKQAEHDI
jgi:hypothetical protein